MPTYLQPSDPGYPPALATVPMAPPLWVRGELLADDALAIAIVGSRRSTPYGVQVAECLARDLAERGVTIVSGLARGIDTAAHRGALQAGGRTLAVLGCGVDVVYPPENARLVAEVEQHGALVSQFPPGTSPLPYHFPARNRLIAGLALGVVVVEAAERSGALITAGLAGELGREVFAVPGRVTSETSRGCHALLRDGAILIRDWADVVSELPEQWRRLVRGITNDHAVPPGGTDDAGRVLAMLSPDDPQDIEQLIERSRSPAAVVGRTLLQLELEGWARQLPGQRWIATTRRM
ncbi:MAG: DNA-protecting protein DprA [Candidatus Rokubacteria bacterium]|nr:DNA-protecting protein DprA [Candidatus Rokubacteria bacterium]